MKLPLSFYYYCILFFLSINKGISQENFTKQWYTSDNNELPQSSVKAIVRDKYNFIWMTTENGLVRYDGNSFQVFNTATTKLNGCRFTEFSGNVKKDSLYCYNEGEKELVLISQRSVQIVDKKIFNDNIIRNGRRFFFHEGLPSTKTLDLDAPFYIRLSDNTNYFINTERIELCDAKMKSIYTIPYKNKSVFNFFTLNDDLYYLTENGEFNCFLQGKTISGKLDPSILKDSFKLYWNTVSQQVFLYSKNKIYRLTARNNQLSASIIMEFDDFDKNNIISIFHDNENQKLYLGSSTNGLCIVTLPSFRTIKRTPNTTDVFYAALPFRNNTVITSEGLIMDAQKITDSIPFMKGDNYTEKITVAKDGRDGIWVVRKLKLYQYLKEYNYKKYNLYDFGQQIKSLYKSPDNVIWVNLQQDVFHKAKLYYISGQPNSKPHLALTLNTNINYVIQYDSGTLYLGAERGLYKYEKRTGKLSMIKNSGHINVRSIFIDASRRIWITTYEKGFFLYNNKRLHSFPQDKNNYLNSSHCIVEDKKGFFWIPTNKGLFQVSIQALLSYASRKTSKVYYHHYNKMDGFLTNEFNGGCQPCGNYLKNNYIFFPSMNGMVVFNPDKIKALLPNKELFVDRIIIDQKIKSPKDTIMLDNNFQRIKFFIDYPYYGNINNLNIEAKLNGTANSRWEKIGSDRSISFTTLPPGKYTFIVRILSGFNSSYKYKSITLIVPAMFYQTLWFKILCCLLILAFIILLWHIRLYYLKVKNRQLQQLVDSKTQKLAETIDKLKVVKNSLKLEIAQQERLVKSISHDIKTPLEFLSFTVRHLFYTTEIQEDEKLKKLVESIQISSVQLYEYVENLVKYSVIFIEGKKLEDKSYSLYELVQEKIQLFEKIAASKNTSIINRVAQKEYIKTNNKALSIIIHNFIDNSIKNTKNGTIELQSETKGNKLFLSVKDNGVGMSKEIIDYYLDFSKKPTLKNYHQGLHMVIELLAILKGDIKIASEINKGTTIEIIVDYI